MRCTRLCLWKRILHPYTFIDFAYEAAPYDDKLPTGCDIIDIH